MSDSAGLDEARGVWTTLLSTLQKRLSQIQLYDAKIGDEDSFRREFEELPEEYHESDPDANYANFSRFHVQILFFIRIVDEAVGLKHPNSLSNVFWATAIAAVKTAFTRKFYYREFRSVYPQLNGGLPLFSSDLSQFPRNVSVQDPLLKIFDTYIQCYVTLIAQLDTRGEEIVWDPIKAKIERAAEVYKACDQEWQSRFKSALDEQKTFVLQNFVGGSEEGDTRFEHIKDLGRGAYGAVAAVREVSTSTVYARKSIPIAIPGSDPAVIEGRVKNEVETMAKLRHNHIASINLYFKGTSYWSIIMSPVADCDLRIFLDERCVKAGYPRTAMRLLDSWFGCLISALAYTHAEMVKHEDIKPNNILIKGEKVYLTDFGTAKDFSELEASTVSDFHEQGTPIYWAPEPRNWGRSADVFALGCVFSEMLTVRQQRTLQDYRRFRFNSTAEFGYAYKSNLKKVRMWLTRELDGVDNKHPIAQLLAEQTLNMLIEDSTSRLEAKRIRHNLRAEEALFCATCF